MLRSIIYYLLDNWREILYLWTILIIILVSITILKHNNIDFKFKRYLILFICGGYMLLSVICLTHYKKTPTDLKDILQVFTSTIFLGLGIILHQKQKTKHIAIIIIVISVIDLLSLFIKSLIT